MPSPPLAGSAPAAGMPRPPLPEQREAGADGEAKAEGPGAFRPALSQRWTGADWNVPVPEGYWEELANMQEAEDAAAREREEARPPKDVDLLEEDEEAAEADGEDLEEDADSLGVPVPEGGSYGSCDVKKAMENALFEAEYEAEYGPLQDKDNSGGNFQRLLLEIAAEHYRALNSVRGDPLPQPQLPPCSTRQFDSLFAASMDSEENEGQDEPMPREVSAPASIPPSTTSATALPSWTAFKNMKTVNFNSGAMSSGKSEGAGTAVAAHSTSVSASPNHVTRRPNTWRELPGRDQMGWRTIVRNLTSFDSISTMAIFVDLIIHGIVANQSVISAREGGAPDDVSSVLQVLSLLGTIWFCLEFLVRLRINGFRGHFLEEDWMWNWLDLVIVVTDFIVSFLQLIFPRDDPRSSNLTAVRVLRVLRITRAVRVLRLVRLFRELRMMLFSIVQSGSALLWSLLLLGMTMYAFSIYFMQVIAYHLSEELSEVQTSSDSAALQDLVYMFGNVFLAEYTLYQAISGGISWGEISARLLDVHVVHAVIFSFYTFFTTFAILNIITGIFVETSLNSARNNQEEIAQAQLRATADLVEDMRKMFRRADADGSGSITLYEFESYMELHEVRAYLDALGIETDKARGLFRLLDLDGSGEITVEEFAFGCLRLKGQAKAIDLATLTNHNRRLSQLCRKFFVWTEAQLSLINEQQARLDQRMGLLIPDYGSTLARTPSPTRLPLRNSVNTQPSSAPSGA